MRNSASEVRLASELEISLAGRWPCQLPDKTLLVVEALEFPLTNAVPTQFRGRRRRCSIVVVTFKGLAFLKLCLFSLYQNTPRRDFELVLVDNSSDVQTRDFLRRVSGWDPGVKLILNEGNRGFAAGMNQGLSAASGEFLVLLNSDTILSRKWLTTLLSHLQTGQNYVVGPVTNRSGNEAEIQTEYATYGELLSFADKLRDTRRGQVSIMSMLSMFCVAMHRRAYEVIGPLDERFGLGLFEDDDYAVRARNAGFQLACAEDTFVHHYGQASFGALGKASEYDGLLQKNRRRFEEKWGTSWKPHRRRSNPEYDAMRRRLQVFASSHLPRDAATLVVSRGDPDLLELFGSRAAHFPQDPGGEYAGHYPEDSDECIRLLKELRLLGAEFIVFPEPSFWWLEYYVGFREFLEQNCECFCSDQKTAVVFRL